MINQISEAQAPVINGTALPLKVSHRSELAQEIISRKPGFMEKWALLLILCVLVILLSLTWFIKYPDIIEANATITATNAPKDIVIRQAGRLVKLFIHNNENVKKNEIFGWIESTADHREVLDLSQRIYNAIWLLNKRKPESVVKLFNNRYNNLGEIQQEYQTFITALQSFNDYMANGFYSRKRRMLEWDTQLLENTKQTIQQQLTLTRQDVTLSEESFNMNKELFDEKVISKADLTSEKSKLMNKQMAIPQLEA